MTNRPDEFDALWRPDDDPVAIQRRELRHVVLISLGLCAVCIGLIVGMWK